MENKKDIYSLQHYKRKNGFCKVCGKPIKGHRFLCGAECDSISHELLLSGEETGDRPVWMVLDIMQKNDITWREYSSNRNLWHQVTYGGGR